MQYRGIIIAMIGLLSFNLLPNQTAGQSIPLASGSPAFFDSIDSRISYLEKQIARSKQARDVSYLNLQRELDHTLFEKTYREFIIEEDLDKAKELVVARIERSEFRRDMTSVNFYRKFEENTYALIKEQRMYYQQLFQKEKNFKREFEKYTQPATPEAFQKALRMVNLALKYARENNLAETIAYLNLYKSYTDALIFDAGSAYDLASLTNQAKSFEKVFQPLITSDSLTHIKKAETLLEHCMNYGRLTGSSLNEEYFKKQSLLLASALSDLLEKQGREKELARYTDQSVVAKLDALNPCGVFKWRDQIIVIDEFSPTSGMENVRKGEAIMHADIMLATYLQKNKLCRSINDLKFGYAYIIPYTSDAKTSSFFYNRISQKWQYIACYTVVVSQSYTLEVSKFMPPLHFLKEMETVDKP